MTDERRALADHLRHELDISSDFDHRSWEDIEAALAALPPAGWRDISIAPDGWQLVPKEPTREMIQACIWALDRWREKNGNVQGFVPPGDKYQVRWRAMLEAAPLPPAPQRTGE